MVDFKSAMGFQKLYMVEPMKQSKYFVTLVFLLKVSKNVQWDGANWTLQVN